jgi:dolichol-phosphate mannosyltransferase
MTKYSVVLTFYNESQNIALLVREVESELPLESELILIDDCSTDDSWIVAQSITTKSVPLRAYKNHERLGLGLSILEGIKKSSGQLILLLDSDFTHNPSDIPRLLAAADNHELTVASRYVKGGGMKPFHLFLASRIYVALLRLYLGVKQKDLLGGYMVMKRSSFSPILHQEFFEGFGNFSLAISLFAYRRDFRIKEVSAVFQVRRAGKKKSNRKKMIKDYFTSARKYKKLIGTSQ